MSTEKTVFGTRASIDRWLTALRSGEYSQAKGRLRKGDEKNFGYCCLGVLVDLEAPNDPYLRTGTVPEMDHLHSWGIKFIGINDTTDRRLNTVNPHGTNCPAVWYDNTWVAVTELNDGNYKSLEDKGLSFNEIADLIEKHVQYTD